MGFAFELCFVECSGLTAMKCSETSRKQSISQFPFMFLRSPSALLCQFGSAKTRLFLPFLTSLLLPISNLSCLGFFPPRQPNFCNLKEILHTRGGVFYY